MTKLELKALLLSFKTLINKDSVDEVEKIIDELLDDMRTTTKSKE